MFLLFTLSFLLVIASSYFITSTIKAKQTANSLIFLSLIFVSQIILTIETLSILKQIDTIGILSANLIVFALSFSCWKRKHFPQIDFSFLVQSKKQILLALKQDKALLVLFIFFIFAGSISLFLALVVPTNSADSMTYHLARIGFWLQNQSLAHFETNSLRQLVFPINSEILIMWPMIFIKRDYLAALNEYIAYWGCILVLFTFLRYLKFSVKRILWAIFILASLPAIIIESTSTQTNLIVAFFLLCSLYLFVYGAREKENKSIMFSAIAYSIALGVKSTAVLFIPIFGIIYILISVRENKKEFYKPIVVFALSSIPAFMLLSSYNYILNFLEFGNPAGPPFFVYKHAIPMGLKAFIASLIKYIILFFSFTGMKIGLFFDSIIMGLKDSLFHILHLKTTDGLVYGDLKNTTIAIHENYAMYGILGFLLILPLIIKSAITGIVSTKSKRFYVGLAALITIGFLISISLFMGFCYWYNRFILTAIVLSAPIFVLSYTRRVNLFKIIIILIVIYNFTVISTNNTSKPLLWVYNALKSSNYTSFRNEIRLRDGIDVIKKDPIYEMVNYLGDIAPDSSKIALILSCDDNYYSFFEENLTWKIFSVRYKLLAKNKNYNDYDYIVISGHGQYTDIYEKKLVYNYSISGNDVIYNQTNPDEAITLYFDKDANPVTSKRPFIAFDVIKFDKIPENFKLVKKFVPDDKNEFYLYKKT
ncbi:MAG: hypothetical protein ACD_20C00183G0003 [uncultured bacterium]|nr:MAG: hypothetical protein ACD_20C00183G0003 [uncultured bacterium]